MEEPTFTSTREKVKEAAEDRQLTPAGLIPGADASLWSLSMCGQPGRPDVRPQDKFQGAELIRRAVCSDHSGMKADRHRRQKPECHQRVEIVAHAFNNQGKRKPQGRS